MGSGDYTPNNNAIWDAAFSGFWAGVLLAKDAPDMTEATANGITAQASVFAQAVDSGIAAGSPNSAQVAFVGQMSQSLLANKYSQGLPESAFEGTAQTIATAYASASAAFFDPGSGSTSQLIVFNPGASSSGNSYETAAEIADVLTTFKGAVIVFLAASAQTIPAGVVWNANGRLTIQGMLTNSPILEIADTAQIVGAFTANGVTLLSNAQTMPSITFSPWVDKQALTFTNGAQLKSANTATMAAVVVPAGTGLFLVGLNMIVSLLVSDAASTVPVIQLASGSSPGTGGIVAFCLLDNADLGSWTVQGIAGDSTTSYVWLADSSNYPIPVWTLFEGSLQASIQIGGHSGDAELNLDTPGSAFFWVYTLGGINRSVDAGLSQAIAAYGSFLVQLDLATYGVSGPNPLNGPFVFNTNTGGAVSPGATPGAYTDPPGEPVMGYGLMASDTSGAFETAVPVAYYPNNPWSGQIQLTDKVRLGDSLTGPNTAGTFNLAPFPNTNPESLASTLTVLARVTMSDGTGDESLGDTFSIVLQATFRYQTPPGSGLVTQVGATNIVAAPNADASMAGIAITIGASGGLIQIGYTNPPLLGAASVVSYQFKIETDVC
jgi:hypothetical protein